MSNHHIPVLKQESIDYLITNKSGYYFDGTIGFGGHSEAFLNILDENALLVGCDVDENAFSFVQKKFENDKRVQLYQYNFSMIDVIAKIESIQFFDGVFADLGVSSFQLDNAESGFTYRTDAPLDLRMNKSKVVTAADLINSFDEEDLSKIFFEFGEEKNSRQIARSIIKHRAFGRIKSTLQLKKIIAEITPERFLNKTLARIFQAIRIYINDELDELKAFITRAISILKPGGRIVIISYHSLEDRIVKESFKYETLDCICPQDFPVCKCEKEKNIKILTKKPILPSDEEIENNSRSRSAKLRAAERI